MDHELKQLEQNLADLRTRLESRQRLRELNSTSNFEYPSESTLSALDSSIKKNSAFVKRVKIFSDSQKEQVLNEIDRLNLTKFISEVATSVVEAKFKLSDIAAVIEICTKLNRKYKDFSKHLLDQYAKSFPVIKKKPSDQYTCNQLNSSNTNSAINNCLIGSSSNNQPSRVVPRSTTINSSSITSCPSSPSTVVSQDVPQINLPKIRVDLRIFSELLLVGIFGLKDGFPVLINLLYYLMVYDKNSHQNASAILTFCKGCGDELLGLARLKFQPLCDKYEKQLEVCNLISPKRQEFLRMHIIEYYSCLINHLGNLHKEYTDIIFKNKKNRKPNGEITKESRELLGIKQSEIVKFHNLLNQFAEILNKEPAALPNLDTIDDVKDANVLDLHPLGDKGLLKLPITSSPWDDEGTRSFYEDLLNLQTLFPNLNVKASTLRKKLALQQHAGREVSSDLIGDKDSKSNSPDLRTTTPTKSSEDGNDELDKTLDSSSSEDSSDEAYASSNAVATSSSSSMALSQLVVNRVQPDQYFSKLSNCSNRDMIDEAAIDFMRFFNTKFGRRKLIKTLFNVQRTRLDLLPFFARLTATLYPYVPSIGTELSTLLRQEFRNLFKKKDQINIESKVKNVRFIGELIKFSLFSEDDALTCLSMLLSDFTHHHIEMTCNLLETCGRLLYTSPVSHHKCRLLLEQMMRKKLLLSVDSKYVTMIENAYYYTNPPEVVRHVVEEPNVNLYVRFLLCDCLNRSTIDRVLSSLKRLDLSNKGLAKFIITCMIESYNLKFFNIRYLAALLAALNKIHPWMSTAVIDGVVEDILLMMEINELHFNQRRIPMIRYFGELYNYKLSDSSLVFKILYILITYGVYYPEPDQTLSQIPLSRIDPPDNLFRIKLVCDLLDTSGHFLSNGPEKKKLDCFLLFFQRYYWFKRHIYTIHPYCMAKSGNQFPASIEYSYNDAILNLRPNISFAKSYPQAIENLQKFIAQLSVQHQPSSITAPTSSSAAATATATVVAAETTQEAI